MVAADHRIEVAPIPVHTADTADTNNIARSDWIARFTKPIVITD